VILKKLRFFLSATFSFRISMLQEIEKIREFHFVKKCKLGNEGCQKGGSGGISIFYIPYPSPPLPDKSSPSPLPFLPLLAGFENPPGPLCKRGRCLGFPLAYR
jgi:hypothetical protein